MVNEEFKREVGRLFIKGFGEALETSAESSELIIKEQTKEVADYGDEFFLLTVSSQLFRLFIVLHFKIDDISKNFTAQALNASPSNVTPENLYDYLGEVGNAFCGSIKRNLNKTVPHLGMSTPNRLAKDCLPYLSSFNIDEEFHAIAEYQGNTLFSASAYISTDSEVNYSVQITNEIEEDADSGELEFF